MLTSTVTDAMTFATREQAEAQQREVHARSKRGPYPWVIVPLTADEIQEIYDAEVQRLMEFGQARV